MDTATDGIAGIVGLVGVVIGSSAEEPSTLLKWYVILLSTEAL